MVGGGPAGPGGVYVTWPDVVVGSEGLTETILSALNLPLFPLQSNIVSIEPSI